MKPDFSGWATKSGIKCTDGRTIMPGAFEHQDKMKVPLVWAHQHDDVENVLGHAILEHKAEGTWVEGFFNTTPKAKAAKVQVEHGDLTMMSIFANNLTERGNDVLHGDIKEVSLVLAGANSGAVIENIYLQHNDGTQVRLEDEAIITLGLTIEHADAAPAKVEKKDDADEDGLTNEDVWNSMTEEQQNLAAALVADGIAEASKGAVPSGDKTNDDGSVTHADGTTTLTDGTLKHADGSITNADGTPVVSEDTLQHQKAGTSMGSNIFEADAIKPRERKTLTHDQLKTIVEDAEALGSLKKSFIKHAASYGIEDIELLFPDAKAISNIPEFIKRRTEWVAGVLNGVHKTPFTRIKTLSADITHDEARAKGYIKGNLKKEEFFKLAKRVTTPKTVYKKQKLDRDDILDITEIDVVAWLKAEMRLMLDEEIARAILISDGREVDDEDKIDEEHIRPIAFDDDFYSEKIDVPSNVTAQDAVEYILRKRVLLKGSGNPTMFATNGFIIDMLLAKDKMGRRLYSTKAELASALMVRDVIEVEVMESVPDILAIIVNLQDYTVGADKGGQVAMFDDFDIDYNQYKYLIEARLSGALTKFKSALVLRRAAGTEVTPTEPTFVPATGVVTIPSKTGVLYYVNGTLATAGAQNAIAQGATVEVDARPADNYKFPHNIDTDWEYTRPVA